MTRTLLPSPQLSVEATDFADTIAQIAARHRTDDPWRPGAHADDRTDDLAQALRDAGFNELGSDGSLIHLIAPAAERLGAALAPVATVDALLAAAPMSGSLVRYPSRSVAPGRLLDGARGPELVLFEAARLEPVPFLDAWCVHRATGLRESDRVTGPAARTRADAFTASLTGYLAGISRRALELAHEHVSGREAFGSTLAALEPVQQHFGEAAMRAAGAQLLTGLAPSPSSLAYALEVAETVTATCQQVVGAIGYTLEFPLQRCFRRASALVAWSRTPPQPA